MRSRQLQGDKTRSGFLRSVFVLVGGTAVAHGITAAAMPFVARLYTPADFSMFAVFSSILAIVSVAACLRFDVAVSLPETDADASNLLVLAIVCAAVVSMVAALVILLAPVWLAAKVGQPRIAPFLWMLPVGAFLAACSSALQGWFIRTRDFNRLARARIAQSVVGAAFQVGMGLLSLAPLGLLVASLMNVGAAFAALSWPIEGLSGRFRAPAVTWTRMTQMFRTYDRFAKYSTWEALSNSAASQVPIIMIAALAAPGEAGYMMLAIYVMQAPMALVGTAVAQVYMSRGPEQFRQGRLGEFTAEIFGGLLKSGAGPLIAAGILSPVAFGFVFGTGWARAGSLVAWMTPWFILQFLASPISMALHIMGRQRAAMMLQFLSLATRVLAVWVASKVAPSMIGEAFAISGLIVYLVYVVLVLVIVATPPERLVVGVVKALPLTGAWVGIAALVAWLLRHLFAGV